MPATGAGSARALAACAVLRGFEFNIHWQPQGQTQKKSTRFSSRILVVGFMIMSVEPGSVDQHMHKPAAFNYRLKSMVLLRGPEISEGQTEICMALIANQ